MSPKHLYVAQAAIPHTTMICALTMRLEGSTLRDERYVNKLSNLLCLTGCGFYDRLEEGGLVGPNMDMQCRVHEPLQLSFSNIAALEQKPNKKLKNIQLLLSFACHVVLSNDAPKRLLVMLVGLIQVPKTCNGDPL